MVELSKETLREFISKFEKEYDEAWDSANAAYHALLTPEMVEKHKNGRCMDRFPEAIAAAQAAVADFNPTVPDNVFDVSDEKWKTTKGLAAVENAYKYIKAHIDLEIKYLHAHINEGHEYFGYSKACGEFANTMAETTRIYLTACYLALQHV